MVHKKSPFQAKPTQSSLPAAVSVVGIQGEEHLKVTECNLPRFPA